MNDLLKHIPRGVTNQQLVSAFRSVQAGWTVESAQLQVELRDRLREFVEAQIEAEVISKTTILWEDRESELNDAIRRRNSADDAVEQHLQKMESRTKKLRAFQKTLEAHLAVFEAVEIVKR
jgi:DNA-binding transcriptional regulator GbsR (MarR family)